MRIKELEWDVRMVHIEAGFLVGGDHQPLVSQSGLASTEQGVDRLPLSDDESIRVIRDGGLRLDLNVHVDEQAHEMDKGGGAQQLARWDTNSVAQ